MGESFLLLLFFFVHHTLLADAEANELISEKRR